MAQETEPQKLVKQELVGMLSMRDFTPDQRMVNKALGIEPEQQGGEHDARRMSCRTSQPGRD